MAGTISKQLNYMFNGSGGYPNAPTQSAYAYALWLGLAPPDAQDIVLTNLLENIQVRVFFF